MGSKSLLKRNAFKRDLKPDSLSKISAAGCLFQIVGAEYPKEHLAELVIRAEPCLNVVRRPCDSGRLTTPCKLSFY